MFPTRALMRQQDSPATAPSDRALGVKGFGVLPDAGFGQHFYYPGSEAFTWVRCALHPWARRLAT